MNTDYEQFTNTSLIKVLESTATRQKARELIKSMGRL